MLNIVERFLFALITTELHNLQSMLESVNAIHVVLYNFGNFIICITLAAFILNE